MNKPTSTHAALAAMALEDARKTRLDEEASGRVRLDAIEAVRSCGLSLREAVTAIDHVLLHGHHYLHDGVGR